MIQVREYCPRWALNEKFAEDMIFIDCNGKLLTAKSGKVLEVDQAKDLDPEEEQAVNQFLISKERLKIQSTIR